MIASGPGCDPGQNGNAGLTPMNPDAHHPLTPITNRVIVDLDRFLGEFFRWEATGGGEPLSFVPAAEEEQIAAAARAIARHMIGGAAVANAKTWRAAARESLHAKRIYQALRTERNSPVGERVDVLISENTKLIQSLPEAIYRRAQAYIGREQQRGTRAETITKNLQKKLPELAASRVKMLARTEVGRAETALTQARAERLGLNWYEWATSEDQRVRVSHRNMASVLVNWADPPSPEALAHEPGRFGRYHPGAIFNCFPGDTLVSRSNGLKRLWRAPYCGDMIHLTVEGGFQLRVTPNHPILTLDGWTPAGSLNEGDYLIQTRDNDLLRFKPDKHEAPTTFDQIFNTWAMHAKGRAAGDFNFYGDRPHSNVDEIAIHDVLNSDPMAARSQSAGDFPLTLSRGGFKNVSLRSIAEVCGARRAGGVDVGSSLIEREASHTDSIRVADVALGNPVLLQDAIDDNARNAVSIGQALLADSVPVVPHDFFLRQGRNTPMRGQTLSGNYHATSAQSLAEGVRVHAQLLRDSVQGNFPYQALRLVQKTARVFNGHVYTLESENGWYCVTPTQIITKNCRCLALPLISLDEVRWPHRVYAGGRIESVSRTQFEKWMRVAGAA